MSIEIDDMGRVERTVELKIKASELAAVHLHIAFPEERNRTDRFMRRHALAGDSACPNVPVRSEKEPPKLPIPGHLDEMRRLGMIPSVSPPPAEDEDGFRTEPAMFAVPISDLAANLLRPAFHVSGLGKHKVFFFDGEPIQVKTYLCACFFARGDKGRFEVRMVRYDPHLDRVLDTSGNNLVEMGLVWAAALVPLVVDGKPQSAVEIAKNDYDLRQILGRDAEDAIRYAYEGWFERWDARVAEIVEEHQRGQVPFSTFYHSILALDSEGNICVMQIEGNLPELAATLARRGFVTAGVLDSGGSCAIYDVWQSSYLNHGWYFREPRGSILVFELKSVQRLPRVRSNSWVLRRLKPKESV